MEILRRRSQPDNGCARALARITRALEAHGTGPCLLAITAADEAELRDCTEAQLGSGGLCAARAPCDAWRRFLVAHFDRHLVGLSFDAAVLEVSDSIETTLVRRVAGARVARPASRARR